MTLVAQLLTLLFALLALKTFIFAWRTTSLFRRRWATVPADMVWPKVRVMLSLRGADPFLPACLHGLLHQDYPHYDVCIVVDSRSDPAWSIAQRAVAACDDNRARLVELNPKLTTCALTNSAVLTALGDLDDSYFAVAIVDADVVPWSAWLRSLVRPLLEPGVGAATGIRWYLPESDEWGTLVRYLWNAAASVQMVVHAMPWGGSLAIRRAALLDSDLFSVWRSSLCYDVPLAQALRKHGWRVCPTAHVVATNREATSLSSSLIFIARQLTLTRLHSARWPWLLIESFATSGALLGAYALAWAALAHADWAALAWVAGGSVLFAATVCAAHFWVEHFVVQQSERQGETIPPIRLKPLVMCLGAGLLMHFAQTALLIVAHLRRRLTWRGVTYRIHHRREIEMVEYRPYEPLREESVASVI